MKNNINYSVTQITRHTGAKSNFYTGKIIFDDVKLNLTYDCNNQNLVVHEWYKLTRDRLNLLMDSLNKYFLSITA